MEVANEGSSFVLDLLSTSHFLERFKGKKKSAFTVIHASVPPHLVGRQFRSFECPPPFFP